MNPHWPLQQGGIKPKRFPLYSVQAMELKDSYKLKNSHSIQQKRKRGGRKERVGG